MNEKPKIAQEEKETSKDLSLFKGYIDNALSELKIQQEDLYRKLNTVKHNFDYLDRLSHHNNMAVSRNDSLETLEDKKEELRNRILFYGILKNAVNPEEVISEYRANNKITEDEKSELSDVLEKGKTFATKDIQNLFDAVSSRFENEIKPVLLSLNPRDVEFIYGVFNRAEENLENGGYTERRWVYYKLQNLNKKFDKILVDNYLEREKKFALANLYKERDNCDSGILELRKSIGKAFGKKAERNISKKAYLKAKSELGINDLEEKKKSIEAKISFYENLKRGTERAKVEEAFTKKIINGLEKRRILNSLGFKEEIPPAPEPKITVETVAEVQEEQPAEEIREEAAAGLEISHVNEREFSLETISVNAIQELEKEIEALDAKINILYETFDRAEGNSHFDVADEILKLQKERNILNRKVSFYEELKTSSDPQAFIQGGVNNGIIEESEKEAIISLLTPQPAPEPVLDGLAEEEISEEEDDDEDYAKAIREIIAGLPEEKRAIFNRTRTESTVPVSFLAYRERMKKERKADFLKTDINKLEEEALQAKNNKEYRRFAEIERDIKKLRRKLWWYLSPDEQKALRDAEREESKVAEKQYKKTMRSAGISGGRGGDDGFNYKKYKNFKKLSQFEKEESGPSAEELALSSEIEKLEIKAAAEYGKMGILNKRINNFEKNLDSVFTGEEDPDSLTYIEKFEVAEKYEIKINKLNRILLEKFDTLRDLFWRINYIKIQIAKLHNEKEWKRDKYMGLGHIESDSKMHTENFIITHKNLPKKTAAELAFEHLGGAENVKKKFGFVKKENTKAELNGSGAALKKAASTIKIKKAPAKRGRA